MSKGVGPNLFKNILPTLIGYLKNILLHLKQNIRWCGRRFCHVLWMNDTYGWKCGWKMKMDELFHEHSQGDKFQTEYKIFMLVYCEQFITWNAWISISNSITTKYIPTLQHSNHMKFEIKSNSVAHKPIDPPKGMCQFKHYLSTTKKYATIRNWDNIKHLRTPYYFKLFKIFIHSSTPWQLA